MTPAARLSAAIEVLDRILAGTPAEQALTNWGRANRFAGSGDRHALRDLVYDALRCRRSYGALGGGDTGRGLILGGLRDRGQDVAALFTGQGHAPPPPGPDEAGSPPESAAALDVPDWLYPRLVAALGPDCDAILAAMRARAPVFLRVNLARATPDTAAARLADDAIATRPVPGIASALEVTGNPRKVQASAAYGEGLVELQDASSQAVVQDLPLRDGMAVLDLCAGGGGKTLAMAARARLRLWAHDANPRRLADLPARAKRAGAKVKITDNPEGSGPYDLILMDVPCSGSGSWRRDPAGKWALSADRLAALCQIQGSILDRAARLAGPDGVLAYATCSLLREENEAAIEAFRHRSPGWTCRLQRRFDPRSGGDGFFLAILDRAV